MLKLFNSFRPYYKIYYGRRSINDFFQFQLHFYNVVGVTITICGYGFDAGVIVHKNLSVGG